MVRIFFSQKFQLLSHNTSILTRDFRNATLSYVTRKPVFQVCDQLRLKPACSAAETSQGFEILAIASKGIILSKQQTTKALIRLRGCAGWSAPLLFAYVKNRFSHDMAHSFQNKSNIKLLCLHYVFMSESRWTIIDFIAQPTITM